MISENELQILSTKILDSWWFK